MRRSIITYAFGGNKKPEEPVQKDAGIALEIYKIGPQAVDYSLRYSGPEGNSGYVQGLLLAHENRNSDPESFSSGLKQFDIFGKKYVLRLTDGVLFEQTKPEGETHGIEITAESHKQVRPSSNRLGRNMSYLGPDCQLVKAEGEDADLTWVDLEVKPEDSYVGYRWYGPETIILRKEQLGEGKKKHWAEDIAYGVAKRKIMLALEDLSRRRKMDLYELGLEELFHMYADIKAWEQVLQTMPDADKKYVSRTVLGNIQYFFEYQEFDKKKWDFLLREIEKLDGFLDGNSHSLAKQLAAQTADSKPRKQRRG